MKKRAALLLSVAVFSSFSSAQVPQIYQMPIYGRVSQAVTTFSEAEILSQFGDSKKNIPSTGVIKKVLPKLGKYVRYGGVLTISASVVNDALNWFYNEAKRSTGTKLDSMYSVGIGLNWEYGVISYNLSKYNSASAGVMYYNYTGIVRYWRYNSDSRSSEDTYYTCTTPANNDTCTGAEAALSSWASSKGVTMASFTAKHAYGNDLTLIGAKVIQVPLRDYVTDSPSRQAVTNVVNDYLSEHPKRIPALLDPIPNANEAADDVVDPGLDTDRDGSTDGDEARRGPGVTTLPGNRPHPADGEPSDPSDPSSRPLDTDGDGVPDWRDADDDNDTVPDADETPDGQKNSRIKPENRTDTDSDGLTDDVDPDDDNDGASDADELAAGTNPKDPTSKPPEAPPCPTGQTRGPDGKCAPADQEPCPTGQTRGSDGKCKPDEEADPGNTCGDMDNFARFMKHPGSYIKDVFIPCKPISDLMGPIRAAVANKFPFSLTSSLDNIVSVGSSGAGRSAVLPDQLGPFKLDWSWITTIISVTGLLFKGFAAWLGVNIVLSRLAGQVVIK